MITGIFLVLLSWTAFLAFIYALGYPLAYLLNDKVHGSGAFRGSLWIGILIATILILTIGVFLPLRSSAAAIIFMTTVSIGVIFTTVIHAKGTNRIRFNAQWNWPKGLLVGALGLSVVYLAAAALGPVTNYDSGLYHLGAIKYAGDFATIPGLANLYFPFGYNTSLYPLGAFMGNGPWEGIGYRLFNGFIIIVLIIELVTRILPSRNGKNDLSIGSYFLLIAVPVSLIPLVSLSDYWVTSPSSDATVLVLTLVAVAYLLDSLTKPRGLVPNASVAFIAGVIAFSLRPTMVVFLLTMAGVIVAKTIHARSENRNTAYLILPATVGLLLLAIQVVRDYFLSGWLQYPLSLFSLNAPWLAADPAWNRYATLGNARNPADIWGSVEGFDWIGPYLVRLPSQWETYFIAVLALLAITFLLLNAKYGKTLPWRTISLAQLPIGAGIVTWFVFSPPTFRFGWGVIFAFLLVLIAFPLKNILDSPEPKIAYAVVPALGIMLIVLVALNTLTRFQVDTFTKSQTWSLGPLNLGYQLTPILAVPIATKQLASGLTVTFPMESDQCWDNYPLCSPIIVPSLSLRGNDLADGFLP